MSCYAAFDNRALMKRIEDVGVPLKVERGGRVFPQSDKASDITKALERMMSKSGVRVCLRSKVRRDDPLGRRVRPVPARGRRGTSTA